MSKNTKYTVKVNDAETESRSKKASAIEIAEQAWASDSKAVVEVVTDAGTVVWTNQEVEAEVEAEVTEATSNRAKPYTRTDASDALPEAVDGYELAYTRNRVRAGVYRKDKAYLVVQFDAAGAEVLREEASNTTQAREVTNRLADEHAKAVAEAKAAEKAAKEKAKADKVAEKAAKLAEKEAEAAKADEAELVEA